MARRRTNAAIADVVAIHDRTDDLARAIMGRIDPEGETPISVKAAAYWRVRADYQRDVASDIVVSFVTKDPAEAERVAQAIKEVLGCSQ